MGAVNCTDLQEELPRERAPASLDAAVKAAGVRERLGELLLNGGRITREELDLALKKQCRSGEKLGAVFVRHGLLSEPELNAVLCFQRYQSSGVLLAGRFRLGEILVATEQITRQQLDEALLLQKISNKKIGALLIEAGHVQPHQIDYGLKLQRQLMTAALVAALAMTNAVAARETFAGSAASIGAGAKVSVSATVLERTSMQILNQFQELVVTIADIQRGYVEVPAASRIQVKSNNAAGYLLAFEVMSERPLIFSTVNVAVGGRDVQLLPGGGWIPQPYIRGGVTMDLSYRFALARGVQPGTYSWPLLVSVQSR